MQKRNEAKAKLLYDTIDSSNGFFKCPVEKDSRSLMNVIFRIAGGDEAVRFADLEQFRDTRTEAILEPAEFRTGELVEPYSSVKR